MSEQKKVLDGRTECVFHNDNGKRKWCRALNALWCIKEPERECKFFRQKGVYNILDCQGVVRARKRK